MFRAFGALALGSACASAPRVVSEVSDKTFKRETDFTKYEYLKCCFTKKLYIIIIIIH